MNTFRGMRVIESLYLEQDGEPVTVRRSWKERLFSRPWKPFQRMRTVIPRVPYRGVVKLNANTLVMHPAMVAELARATSVTPPTGEEPTR